MNSVNSPNLIYIILFYIVVCITDPGQKDSREVRQEYYQTLDQDWTSDAK